MTATLASGTATGLTADGARAMPPSVFGQVAFEVPADLEASTPPERLGHGRARHDVRLLVSERAAGRLAERPFADIGTVLGTGDVLVVNTSATIPAALDATTVDGTPVRVHLSTQLPGAGLWTVELRRPDGRSSRPCHLGATGDIVSLDGGARLELLGPVASSTRLWVARAADAASFEGFVAAHGMPIRYPYVGGAWPLEDYQTVFAAEPGSAEMPSAARPFTTGLVTALVSAGVEIVPIVLHTGVSSLEAPEPPYPEWFSVPFDSARRVNAARATGARVLAVGTTVVRALESAVDRTGTVHPAHGYTDLVVSPARPVRSVDGLLTGWHAPLSSHLAMLEAIAGPDVLATSYRYALDHGLRWHEFGDSHLILP